MLYHIDAPTRPGSVRDRLLLPLMAALLLPGCFDPVSVPDVEDDPDPNWSWGSGGGSGWTIVWPDVPPDWDHGDPAPFITYAPSGTSSSTGRPLLVLLHDEGGGGDYSPADGWSLDAAGGWSALAEAERFLLAAPGLTWGADPPHEWTGDDGDVDYVALVTQLTWESYNVDLDRVYVGGLGTGGAAALRALLERDAPWAAAGLHAPDPGDAPWDIPRAKERRLAPVAITHHPHDAVVDHDQSLALAGLLADEGSDVELIDDLGDLPDGHHGIDPQVAAILWDFVRAHIHDG